MVVAQSGERIPTTPIQEGAEPSPSTTRKPSGAGVSDENRLDEIIKSVLGDTQVMPIYSSKEEIIHVKDLPRFRDSTNGEEGGKFQVSMFGSGFGKGPLAACLENRLALKNHYESSCPQDGFEKNMPSAAWYVSH